MEVTTKIRSLLVYHYFRTFNRITLGHPNPRETAAMSLQQHDIKEEAVAVKAEHYDGDQPTTENIPAYLPTSDVRVRQKKSKDERRLVLKQDFVILPLLAGSIFFAYLVSFAVYS
jgi:hypothetical protein